MKRSWSDLIEEILQSQMFQGRTGKKLLLAFMCIPVVALYYLAGLIYALVSVQ